MAAIVHTYRSGESGLFANSYLVEGTDGIVAIDAPLLLSDGRWLLGDGHTAFVGDLAFSGAHANLADGRTQAWLQALDRAEEALAGVRTLYVGHGPPAAPAVLADQRRYLLMARETIGRAADGRAQLTEDEANRVAGIMERYLPGAPLSRLVAASASAVAAELAQETALR